MIFFALFSMRLSMSHDSSHKFDRLTRVDQCCFLYLFLIDSFFNFIIQHCVDWESSFIIYFNLLYNRLLQSHDPSREFNMLTWVDSGHFLIFSIDFFSILGLMKIKLYNLFDLFSIKLLWSHTRHADWQVNPSWSE